MTLITKNVGIHYQANSFHELRANIALSLGSFYVSSTFNLVKVLVREKRLFSEKELSSLVSDKHPIAVYC